MALLLGIDTGGTYTDAVLFQENRGVVAAAKALTTRRHLSEGIENALAALPSRTLGEVEMVSLSTTLATNSIVEGRGGRVCLVLIGYPNDALDRAGLGEAMAGDPVVFIRGGHTVAGDEQEPLDEAAAETAAAEWGGRVSAFAVSGYFGVKNPTHENRVRKIIRGRTGLPVTCGHELTSNLHASRRALTAAFNARLVPLLQNLILSVQDILVKKGISAPLMVVKGDGSLMDSRFALEYPIETILSGPAASVVGATFLSGLKDSLVSDIGGTTTDVAILRDGSPILNTEGAVVGGRHLMVEAVQIYTFGLGGDSEVRFGDDGGISLGPNRIVPVSLLATEHPDVVAVLEAQAAGEEFSGEEGRFVVPLRSAEDPGFSGEDFSRTQREIFAAVKDGIVPLADLARNADSRYLLQRDLSRLVNSGIVAVGGFTPSDAAHVLGYQGNWSREAAEAAAALLVRMRKDPGSEDVHGFCRRVYDRVCGASAAAVLEAALAEGHGVAVDKNRALFSFLSAAAFAAPPDRDGGADGGQSSLVRVNFGLDRKIVGIGAPAATYYPRVGKLLATETVIPRHADVANAVGAVAGNVIQKARITVEPLPDSGEYRAHGPEGVADFPDLDAAVRFAEERARAEAENLVRKAGADNPEVRVVRQDRTGRSLEGEILLEVLVTATAAGRPRIGRGV